jgi:acyl-CoA synthetase (AMP-forming)/AMP-acid ligase II/acyl carrier protein
MIQHRSLVNAYSAWETVYQLGSTVQCHLQMASFSFDVFAGDLVRALCSGGKLVLCPHDVLLSPSELHALIQRERIDCAEFVPAVLRGLVQHLEADRRRLDLPVLICGSDSWYVGEYKKFRQFLTSETRLINSFGLTEATIDSACFEDPHLDLPPDRSVPIGRPLSNTQIYLLNPALQPVPIGVLGELYVGGEGVARGYIQRPDLTAERFVPYPFGKPGARLYRTGDLARYLPDGNIEFLGRQDTQVKIRGFRVELGEIDAVLAEHPLVQECATLVCEAVGRPDSNHLVAYVACLDGQISGDELRHFLKSKLPDYMVPTTFMFLEALPLTPNGKVDRNFLPDPDHQQLDSQETFVAPRTPIEETVAKIWAQVLGAEGIGIHDNFFQVGGHSLLVTQIVSRIRTAFEFELPLRSLFESPTIARLAELIETAQWAKQCSHLAGRPTDDREEETV